MIRNLASLQNKLNRMPEAAVRAVTDELAAAASEMHAVATKRIQRNSGTGRVYQRGGRSHVASSPGEYPNADRGGLVRSLGWYSTGLTAYFFASAKHARPLELGTSRMAARPFMRPTYHAVAPGANERIKAAVRLALRQFYG